MRRSPLTPGACFADAHPLVASRRRTCEKGRGPCPGVTAPSAPCPAILFAALALTAMSAPVTLAGSGSTTCHVRNVTQGTQGHSFGKMVAASHDGDRLRVWGTCTSTGVVIDKDLTIQGMGTGATLQSRFGSAHRVLRVTEGARVELRDLIVQGGWLDCSPVSCRPVKGAGILNQGRLTLVRVVVQGNGGLGVSGLGIWNGGTLILRRSVVRRNEEQDGGDAAIVNRGTMTLRHSRVRHNDQAGILNSGVARIVDSVVAEHRGWVTTPMASATPAR